MKITIRAMTIDDYDTVMELWRSAEGIGLSDADSHEGIAAYLERNPGLSVVAEVDGGIVAAVLAGQDGRRGYIHHLAVREGHRRMGLGRKLVEKCLADLKRLGIQKCHLFVFSANADAIAFWRQTGWTLRQDLANMSKDIS